MFRQTARFASRVAASQQRRAFSSQNAQRSVAPKKVAAVVGGSILLWIAFKPSESQNAGFFSGSAQPVDIKKVRTDIADAIEAEDAKRGDGTSIGPTLVRLAWHASGTYSIFDKTGGSNGATMRFKPDAEWGANAGLKVARDFVDQIVKKHPGLSVADAWTLAGVVAIEVMGGPVIPWRAGRKDAATAPTAANSLPNGRLPNADMGCPAATNSHIRDIFGRMGFSDREIVALTGAHALGRCHENASGYWGPWTRAESTFSNEFFNVLLNEKWTPKTTHNGKPWQGPAQYESKDGALMMLPSDMALLEDKAFRPFVELYAKDEEVFFKDFSAAFAKLTELGVSFPAK